MVPGLLLGADGRLFALGAMSVAWMVLIAALIAAERLLPWRALATTGVASVLAAVAIGVAGAPAQVPRAHDSGQPDGDASDGHVAAPPHADARPRADGAAHGPDGALDATKATGPPHSQSQ